MEHVEVCSNTIMWSVDEPLSPEQPDVTVGVVYLRNPNDGSAICIKVCLTSFTDCQLWTST